MNILILDNDELLWQGIEHFKQMQEKWNFFNLSTMKNNKYDLNNIDLVIVDISDHNCMDIYRDILKNFPNKKIIVLTESLKYCPENDCNYCVQNNQMRRLMKPIDLQNIYDLILSFDLKCDFYDAFDDISKLLINVIKRYSTLIYNEINNEVLVKERKKV